MATPKCQRILFTAFEPSGDALAAPIIRRLLKLRPDLEIHAFGGPKMKSAGAKIIELTTERATMLLGAVSQVGIYRKRLQHLSRWLGEINLSVLVPVDSPAANWSICKLVRRTQPAAQIVHLAAPQLWAWAPWRIHKLRRLTDQVLCLLPFEPDWFKDRGVPAVFVGHPMFEARSETNQSKKGPTNRSEAPKTKIALLPGSRVAEIRANWPTMVRVFSALQANHSNLYGQVATADENSAKLVREVCTSGNHAIAWPDRINITTAKTDEVLKWADMALVVSGTATLQCAANNKPMVVLYNVSRWAWWLWARWVVQTDTFALPNLIAQAAGNGRIVPELVPHFGDPKPVIEAMQSLIGDCAARDQQKKAFERIHQAFDDRSYSNDCAQRLIQSLEHLA